MAPATAAKIHEARTSCYTDFVKRNVTVALDEETARWARVEAARRDLSVSALLAGLLRENMARSERYEEMMKQYLSRAPVELKRGRARYPTRDQVHERADIR